MRSETVLGAVLAVLLMAGSFSVFMLSGIFVECDGYDIDREYDVTHTVGDVQYTGTARSTVVYESDAYHNYEIAIRTEEGGSCTFVIIFSADGVPENLNFDGTEDGFSVYSGTAGGGTCTIKVGEKCQITEFEYADPTGEYRGKEVAG